MDCPYKPLYRNICWKLFFFIVWVGFSQLLWAQSIPASLNWTSATGGILFSSPTIDSSGTIYIGSNDNKLHAISSADGTTIWTFTTDNWVDTTPALSHDESVVYFGSWDNKLYAVNAETGTEIWSFETNSYIQSSPAIGLDGKIYFGSMDSIFYALESNGSLAWEYFVGQPIFSSPAIGPDGTLYFGDENGTLHAFHSNGSEKWTYLVDEGTDTNRSILSSPTLDSDGNIYFGSGNGYCYSIHDDGSQATLNWKYLTGDRVDASPALGLNDEVFFVSRDGYLRSLPLFSATPDNLANWEVLVGDVFYSSPVVDENGRVYLIGYAGSGENHLFAYDVDGTKAWDSNVSNPPFTIPSVVDSSLLLSDNGDLYFGCFDQNLYSISLGVAPANSGWPMFRRNSTRNGDWPNFSLTLQSSPDTGGSTTGQGQFYQGSSTTITATPNTGFLFTGWTGDGVSNPNALSTTVSMTEARTLSASFSINSYDLTISAGDGGSVSQGGSFTYGSSPTITATPDTGYSFAGWTGEGVSDTTSPSTTIIMTDDRNLTANFTPREIGRYLLMINSLPTSGGVTSGADEYEDQSNASITAQAVTGYSFSHWLGEGITNPSLSITSIFMNQDRNITANFTINSYDLNISSNNGGEISGEGTFSYGTEANISANPNVGYSFSQWTGDGVVNPLAETTQVRMTQDRNVSASFSIHSYDLSISAGDGGRVSEGGSFTYGSSTTITATPDTGYSFAGWTGDGVSDPTSLSTTVSMTQDRNVSASFSIHSYDLTTSAGDGGRVSEGGSFTYGSSPTITATPDTGYSFAGWTGDGVVNPLAESTQVRMTQDRNVSASFSIHSYDLSISVGDGGSVSEGGSFTYGSSPTITATPDTGYFFAGWTGDGVSDPTSLSTTVSMTQDRNVSASFSIHSHDLSISAGDGGTVSQGGSFTYGSSPTITATPDTGYSFAGWTGEGVVNPLAESTQVRMTQDRNVSASFSIHSYDLSISVGDGGTVSQGGSFTYGSSPTITATPDTGYSFAGWTGEGVSDPTSLSTTVSMTQDRNVSASFSIHSHDLSISAGDGGRVSEGGSFTYGSSPTITATPDTGYSFAGWTGEGLVNPLAESTQVRITQDRNVSASFSIHSYDLSISAGDGGTVSQGGSFTYGSSPTITATSDTGYSFAGWTGEGISDTTSLSTTVSMTQDRNVSASFSIHSYNLSVSAGDGGTVTGNGFFDYGSDALVTARPNLGFSFTGWVGDGVINPLAESTQVRMTENRHISASFSLRYHSLSLQASEGGFVSESGSFLYGSSVSISAIPQVGYSFLSWTGEGVSNRFSTTNEVLMDQDRNISASFTISITAGLELSSLGGNWYSSWFGIFYQSSNHWVYHFNLGWIFLTIDGSNLWIWNDQHGWLWTSPTQYLENFLWSAKLETWIYLELKEPSEPRIWNYDSSSWTPWFP